ncbi:MAG: tellurite resistance TerB family protein [Burkholderiales bacterium]|nr:tellurite resistance TerB family protein [Burkholderiales bacterium]
MSIFDYGAILILIGLVFIVPIFNLLKSLFTGRSSQEVGTGPSELQVKITDESALESGEKVAYKAIKMKGLVPTGLSGNQTMEVVCKLVDITGGNKDYVLALHGGCQEDASAVYEERVPLGVVAPSTGWADWTQIGLIVTNLVYPPHKGLREIKVACFLGYTGKIEFNAGSLLQSSKAHITGAVETSFTHYFSEGYKDRKESAEKANSLVIRLAMNVAMADGSLADAEGKAIKAWIERAISPYSADETERLKKIYNESLKSSYKELFATGSNVDQVVRDFKKIADKKSKYDAMTLCYAVMSADGEADPAELKLLNNISHALDLNPEEINKIRDKELTNTLGVLNTDGSLDSILGISEDWSKEKVKSHLTSEFQKWNNRLMTLPEGQSRDNAQEMLDKISETRRKYNL